MGTLTNRRHLRVGLIGYGLDRPAAGIARYSIELAKALKSSEHEIDLVLLQPFEDQLAHIEGIENAPFRGGRLLPGLMTLGTIAIDRTARKQHLDVVHDPTGVAPFIVPSRLRSFKTVVTIHDMVPFIYPETHDTLTNILFRRYMPVTLRFVDQVVTVSDSSKRDIHNYYKVEDSKVHRIYCGVSDRFSPSKPAEIDRVIRKYQITSPYILSVGSLQPRKNLEATINAFAALRSRGVDHSLVLVGSKAWKSKGLFARVRDSGVSEHIHLTGYVDDEDLPGIYSGADCFVFPSLYEGFGLPPLEAMACGAPVVAANTSSIPEVIGEAALLVDPRSVDKLVDAIGCILTRPSIADDYRQRGLARAKQFSWTRAAAAHAALYRSIVR